MLLWTANLSDCWELLGPSTLALVVQSLVQHGPYYLSPLWKVSARELACWQTSKGSAVSTYKSKNRKCRQNLRALERSSMPALANRGWGFLFIKHICEMLAQKTVERPIEKCSRFFRYFHQSDKLKYAKIENKVLFSSSLTNRINILLSTYRLYPNTLMTDLMKQIIF